MKIMSNVRAKVKDIYKKYGWKAVVGLFAYYLVRDLTLYVAIPYLLLNGRQLDIQLVQEHLQFCFRNY